MGDRDRRILEGSNWRISDSQNVRVDVSADTHIHNFPEGGHCPDCGRKSIIGHYRCSDCGRDFFCPDHFDVSEGACLGCRGRRNRRRTVVYIEEGVVANASQAGAAVGIVLALVIVNHGSADKWDFRWKVFFVLALGAMAYVGVRLLAVRSPWLFRRIAYALLFTLFSAPAVGIIEFWLAAEYHRKPKPLWHGPAVWLGIMIPAAIGAYLGWRRGDKFSYRS